MAVVRALGGSFAFSLMELVAQIRAEEMSMSNRLAHRPRRADRD
jgi:hypothetical protein